MSFLPQEISDALKQAFDYPSTPLIASVASVAPTIRTMRVFDFDEEGCPILLTHKESGKWHEFSANPRIALSCISEDQLVQITLKGKVSLETGSAAYWERMRPDIKRIYHPSYKPSTPYVEMEEGEGPEEQPETFGLMRVRPSLWELLLLEAEAYVKSLRYRFTLSDHRWGKQRLMVG